MLKDGQIYRDNQKGIVLRVPSSHEKEITILYHSAGYVGICKTRLATQVRKGLDWCEVCQRRTWDPGGRNAFHLMSSLKHSRKSQAVMLFKSLYWLITELVLFKRVSCASLCKLTSSTVIRVLEIAEVLLWKLSRRRAQHALYRNRSQTTSGELHIKKAAGHLRCTGLVKCMISTITLITKIVPK